MDDYDFRMALRNPATDPGAHAYGSRIIDEWFDFDGASMMNVREEAQSLHSSKLPGCVQGNHGTDVTAKAGMAQQEDPMEIDTSIGGAHGGADMLAANHFLDGASTHTQVHRVQQLADVTSPRHQATSSRGNGHTDIEMADVQHDEPAADPAKVLAADGQILPMPWSGTPLLVEDEFATLMSDVELLESEGHFNIDDLHDNAAQPPAPHHLHSSPPPASTKAANELADASYLFGLEPPSAQAVTPVSEQIVPSSLTDQAASATHDQKLVAPSHGDSSLGIQAESAVTVTAPAEDPTEIAALTTTSKIDREMAGGPPHTPAPLAESFTPYERGHRTGSTSGAVKLRTAVSSEQNLNSPPESSPVQLQLGTGSADFSMKDNELGAKIYDQHHPSVARSSPLAKKRRIVAAKKPRIGQFEGLYQNESSICPLQPTTPSSPVEYLPHQRPSAAPELSLDAEVRLAIEQSPEIDNANAVESTECKAGVAPPETDHGVRLLQQKPRRKSTRLSLPAAEPDVDEEATQPLPYTAPIAGTGDSEAMREQSVSSELSSANEDILADSSALDASLVDNAAADSNTKKKSKKPAQKKEVIERKSNRARKGATDTRAAPVTVAADDESRPAKRAKVDRRSTLKNEVKALGGIEPAKETKTSCRSSLKFEMRNLGAAEPEAKGKSSKRKTRGQEAEEAKSHPNAAMAAKSRTQQRKK